jgi:hypothetical protein
MERGEAFSRGSAARHEISSARGESARACSRLRHADGTSLIGPEAIDAVEFGALRARRGVGEEVQGQHSPS